MVEPRMRERKKGVQQFSTAEMQNFLFAFGASPTLNSPQLAATIKCLDEIVTDYIIETAHAAALCASYSRRNKIKVDDFKFVLRRDSKKLGRVLELLERERILDRARRGGEGDMGWAAEGKQLQRLGRAEARKEERAARKRGGREGADEEDGDDADRATVDGESQDRSTVKEPKKRGRKKMRKD